MQMRFSATAFFSILVFLVSCKQEEISEFTDTPVLESYIQPGDYLNVKISRQTAFSSNVSYSSDNIDQLDIKVMLNNNTVHKLLPIGDGKYIDSSLIVSENDQYVLSFPYNSKNITAYTYIPSQPSNITQSDTVIYIERMSSTSGPPTGGSSMADPVTITWDNTDHSYYLIIVENIESTLDPIRDFGDDTPPSNLFRKQPTNSSSEEIRTMEFQYYGTHRIIIYHVLPDYAALYNQNSTNSQNLTNPSSNIANGYGIFTGLNSDTLWLEVKEE